MNPEPQEIIIGDSVTWKRRQVEAVSEIDGGVPETVAISAADGWALKITMVGRNGIVKIDATADDEDPRDFKFTATAATTATWSAGDYQFQISATKTTTRYTIAEGWITLVDNLAVRSAAYDNRTHARKVLDAIEAVLEKRATLDQQNMTIDGKTLNRTPFEELVRVRARYWHEVENEEAVKRLASGRPTKRKILTRFV